jgi:hypothetical protein
MGSDDLFRKIKARKTDELKRKVANRELYDKVLIVCEGEKTEPFYIEALRDHFQLATANIYIDPNSDSSPTSVVAYAKKLVEEHKYDSFDRVFCVIDRDRHADFDKAIAQIAGFKSKTTTMEAIVSTPCFEYWILLHFVYTTKIFGVSGDSPCQELIRDELRTYISEYQKADAAILTSIVQGQLGTAIANSKRAYEEASRNGTDNPLSTMHVLVEYLKNLKN